MRIAIDIDSCVCIERTNSDEAIAEGRPYAHAVESVNGWYDAGHDTHIASHRAQRSLTATRRWLAARSAQASACTKTRCPSAQTMKYGPGRQVQSSSRCHRISTRCTDAPQSWQGGEARAIRSALSIAPRGPCVRSPFRLSSSIRSLAVAARQ